MLSLVTSLVDLAKSSNDAAGLIDKSLPETGHFWRYLEKRLKNDPDVPWEAIRSHCYLQPTFIDLSYQLIHGVEGCRASLEAHFTSFVEQPENGRYEKEQLVARIMVVAEEAAVESAANDRVVGLAGRLLLEERIANATREMIEVLGPLHPEVQQISHKVQLILEMQEQNTKDQQTLTQTVEERPKVVTSHVPQGAPTIPTSTVEGINREEMEALLQAQADEFQRITEDTLARFRQPTTDPLREARDETVVKPATVDPSVSRVDGSSPVVSDFTAARHEVTEIQDLRGTAPEAASRLEALHDQGGVSAVAAAISDGTFDAGPVDLLVAAARILSSSMFQAQCESAFLSAARLATDPLESARQYVRASGMASIQGLPARAREHLDVARELAPDHPAVLIAEARASSDSQFILQHIEGVEAENSIERAVLHQTRAQALLIQGDEERAREEHEAAKDADPTNDIVVEFGAVLEMQSAHRRVDAGEKVDDVSVREAANVFEGLAVKLSKQRRRNEAAQLSARAAEAYLLLHEINEATRALQTVTDPESLSPETVLRLAQIAAMIDRPDLVLQLVPAGLDLPLARFFRADAQAHSEIAEERRAAVAVLRGLLEDTESDVVDHAAFALLSSSITFRDVAWDETAARIVAASKPNIEAGMRAERALLLGDPVEAQRLLLPYARQTTLLRRLRDYAALAGEWEKVKDRSRELIRREQDPNDRLALAEAFRRLDERTDAEREFRALAGDDSLRVDLRESAFRAIAEIVGSNRDYEAIRVASQAWHDALPESSNATWNLMFALARLSRHADAWTLAQAANMTPDTEERATLFGEILSRAAPRAEALQLLTAVSDRFERRIEAVEALIIMTALDAKADEPTDAETGRRVQETFDTFSARFPDSKIIKEMPAPETPAELTEFFEKVAGAPKLELHQEIAEGVSAGRAPVNALAAVSGASIGKAWSRLRALPLGFAMEERNRADREAAQNALGSAAIWDSSSIFIVAGLSDDLEQAIRTSLLGSMVVTETLEDIDRDIRVPGKPVAETFHTATGEFGIHETSEKEVEQEQTRATNSMSLVKEFDVQPALGPHADAELTERFKNSENRPEFQAIFGTLLLAQRTRRPVFSDDRFIREAARSLGLTAFGTVALLDVMHEAGLIDAEAHRVARCQLAASGGWGIDLDGTELAVVAKAAGFALTLTTAGALKDRARWRANPSFAWEQTFPLLLAAQTTAPDTFRAWVWRALDAAQNSLPEMKKSWTVENMLLVAWSQAVGQELSREFFHAIVREVKSLPSWLTDSGYDPILSPLTQMLTLIDVPDADRRSAIFRLLVACLRVPDQITVVLAFASATRQP